MKLQIKRLPLTKREALIIQLTKLRVKLRREMKAKGRLLEMRRRMLQQLKQFKLYADKSKSKRERSYFENLTQWGRTRLVLNLLSYMEGEGALAWSKASGNGQKMTYIQFEKIACKVAKEGVTAEMQAKAGVSSLTLIPKGTPNEWRPLCVPSHNRKALEYCLNNSLLEAVREHEPKDSFAYRPKLSALDAAREVEKALSEGYDLVSNEDLTGAFDHLDRGWIKRQLLSIGVDAKWVEILITSLQVPIENHANRRAWKSEDGNGWNYVKAETPEGKILKEGRIFSDRGIAQGGVTSPTLFNLGMNALHKLADEWEFRIIRYADDYVVMAKSVEKLEEAIRLVGIPLKLAGLSRNEKKCWKSRSLSVLLGYSITAENVMPNLEWMRKRSKPEEVQVLDTCVNLAEHLKATDLIADWYDTDSKLCLISPYSPNHCDAIRDFLFIPSLLGRNRLSTKWVMDRTVEYTERERLFAANIAGNQRDLYMDEATPPILGAEISIHPRKVNIETMQYIVDVLTGYYGYKALKALNEWMVGKTLLPIKSTVMGENRPALVRAVVISGKLGYYFRPLGLKVRGLWNAPDADKILCDGVQEKIAEMQGQLDVTEDTDTTQCAHSRSVVTQSSISNKECSNAVSIAVTPTEERWNESLVTSDFVGYEELTDESLYGMTNI